MFVVRSSHPYLSIRTRAFHSYSTVFCDNRMYCAVCSSSRRQFSRHAPLPTLSAQGLTLPPPHITHAGDHTSNATGCLIRQAVLYISRPPSRSILGSRSSRSSAACNLHRRVRTTILHHLVRLARERMCHRFTHAHMLACPSLLDDFSEYNS
jgi:hypothetical protein